VPSIINGLFAGRSGIASHGMAISVSGDNISNANTIGFKSSRASFEDIMAGEGILGKQVGLSRAPLSLPDDLSISVSLVTDFSFSLMDWTVHTRELAISRSTRRDSLLTRTDSRFSGSPLTVPGLFSRSTLIISNRAASPPTRSISLEM
jgi:hypothetical protein